MTPTLLVPGLLCSARLFAPQLPELWRSGPVTVADHTRADRVEAIARGILADAPPRFALAGLSMGGYLAFEILRQAPERVERLALLDTGARADAPEQTERRRRQIELTRQGRFEKIADLQLPLMFHAVDHERRELVRLMARETGPEAFIRQQTAIIGRPDSRPDLGRIRCPALVLVGADDQLTPPEWSEEMADGIPGATLVVLPGCGHLSPLERPREVTRALGEWLA